MQLREVMTPSPEIIAPDASVADAAAMMRELNVGALPVCENDTVIGLVTDRDITVRATAEHRNPDFAFVREVMSPRVVFCLENEDVDHCAQLMEEKQIRRIPVLSEEKRLVGIVSLGDLAVNTDQKLGGKILEKVSEPAQPNR
jgi:CBS domain-containing protein